MLGTGTELRKGLQMLRRRIALVLREAVSGILALKPEAIGVTRRLRENRRRSDEKRLGIALDDIRRVGEGSNWQSIDKNPKG